MRKWIDDCICIYLEQSFLRVANQSWVLSFTEKKVLQRLYGCQSHIFPALNRAPSPRYKSVINNTWLLVGNWDRMENCAGATAFFLAYVQILQEGNSYDQGSFTIAGNGSKSFFEKLLQINNQVMTLKIRTLAHYEDLLDFSEVALLAPILEGAGIKLKTLEAWSCNIPVIGTAQAFSGLPRNLWQLGGVKVDSTLEMAKFCLDWKNAQRAVATLEPVAAYKAYLDLTSAI